jgi:hypothetical protein
MYEKQAKKVAVKRVAKIIPTSDSPKSLSPVYIAPLHRGRCNRCHRSIILRYTGQKYGPVCIKKIEYENGNTKDENNSQTNLHSFVSKLEVV